MPVDWAGSMQLPRQQLHKTGHLRRRGIGFVGMGTNSYICLKEGFGDKNTDPPHRCKFGLRVPNKVLHGIKEMLSTFIKLSRDTFKKNLVIKNVQMLQR